MYIQYITDIPLSFDLNYLFANICFIEEEIF